MLRNASLELVRVLDERHVAALDQEGLLEARALPEEHGEHHLVDLRRQVLHKEHVRGLLTARRGGLRPCAGVRHELWRDRRRGCPGGWSAGERLGLHGLRLLGLNRLRSLALSPWLEGAVLKSDDVRLR